jgi:hypothetical protein
MLKSENSAIINIGANTVQIMEHRDVCFFTRRHCYVTIILYRYPYIHCTYVLYLGANRIPYASPSFLCLMFNYFNIYIPVFNSSFSVVDPA